MLRSGSVLLTLVLLAISVHSQTIDTSFFNGLRYRLIGPARGGRVTTVTGVPSQPKTFYMGVASGGLFKTTDSGATWIPITDGKVPLGSTGSVAVAEPEIERRPAQRQQPKKQTRQQRKKGGPQPGTPKSQGDTA